MQSNHWNIVEACLFTDTNLIGSSSWFVMCFPQCSSNLFLLMTAQATRERGLYHWRCTLCISNESNQIGPRFQSGLYSLKQSMSNLDKLNRWTHRETHLITLSFHLLLPATTAIISHYIEQFSPGNLLSESIYLYHKILRLLPPLSSVWAFLFRFQCELIGN